MKPRERPRARPECPIRPKLRRAQALTMVWMNQRDPLRCEYLPEVQRAAELPDSASHDVVPSHGGAAEGDATAVTLPPALCRKRAATADAPYEQDGRSAEPVAAQAETASLPDWRKRASSLLGPRFRLQ